MPLITVNINRGPGLDPAVAARRRTRRRAIALVGAVTVASGALVAGSAGADPAPPTFTAITPFKLITATQIAATKSLTKIVIGGTTTVPTDASSLQLNVTVTNGTQAGALLIYPAGAPTTAPSLTWTAGQSVTQVATVGVGTRNEATFVNQSSGTVKLTVTITGYAAGGAPGPKGDQGLQGIQGVQGPPGVKGDQGIQGIQGIQGVAGTPGTPGTPGAPGGKGDQGIQGIQGVPGPQGPGATAIVFNSNVSGSGSTVTVAGQYSYTADCTVTTSGSTTNAVADVTITPLLGQTFSIYGPVIADPNDGLATTTVMLNLADKTAGTKLPTSNPASGFTRASANVLIVGNDGSVQTLNARLTANGAPAPIAAGQSRCMVAAVVTPAS